MVATNFPREVMKEARYPGIMDVVNATATINAARSAVEEGKGLKGTGFWKLVSEIKRDPSMDRYIEDVAEIDQRAFENWALFQLPLGLGTALMVVGTLFGLFLIGLSYSAQDVWSGTWLVVGTGVVLVTTHGLAHLAVGAAVGIRFTSWFIGTIGRPQPGVKTDYVTYLRTPARSRAWMHASGAIVSKLVPFLMIGAGLAANSPGWSILVLAVIGIGSVLTDILWSTKASDWKKFSREMRFANETD